MLKWLTIVVTGLCAVLAVSAFSRSTVSAAGAVTIVNTSTALLSVSPCTGTCSPTLTNIAYYGGSNGNQVILDFTKGFSATTAYGFETGSTYKFNNLVTATNQAGRAVNVWVVANNGGASSISGLIVQDQSGNVLYGPGATTVSVANQGVLNLTFRWSGFTTSDALRLYVEAK